jgi:hypothetical protein
VVLCWDWRRYAQFSNNNDVIISKFLLKLDFEGKKGEISCAQNFYQSF